MKRLLIFWMALLLGLSIPGASNAAVHFGLPSAVKNTVKKLKEKAASKATPASISGTVVLPAGAAIQISNLSVLTYLDRQQIRPDSSFTVGTGVSEKQQLIVAVSSTGKPVLLSYASPGGGTGVDISAKSTAKTLILMNPFFLGTSKSQRDEILQKAEYDSNFPALVTAIEQLIISGHSEELLASTVSVDSQAIYQKSVNIGIDILNSYGITIAGISQQNQRKIGVKSLAPSVCPYDYPCIQGQPGGKINFVNQKCAYYAAGVYPNNSTSSSDVVLIDAKESLISLWQWPPGPTPETVTQYNLSEGNYRISLYKGFPADVLLWFNWNRPEGRATIYNFGKALAVTIDLVAGLDVGQDFKSLPDYFGDIVNGAGIASTVLSIDQDIRTGDSVGFLTDVAGMFLDHVDAVCLWLWRGAANDAERNFVKLLFPVLKNINFVVKALSAAEALNSAAPFFYDMVYSSSPITYFALEQNGVLVNNIGDWPPDSPSIPSPANNANHTSTNLTLSWVSGDPNASDAVTYDIYLESNNNTPQTIVANGLSVTTYDIAVSLNNQYYWQVLAKDNHGAFTKGPIWKFTTTVAVNHNPIIASLIANPASISTGTVTTVTCSASDPDSDTLTYNWSAASGAISGSGYQVTWTAPASSSTYSIGCTVSDGNGGSVQRSTNVVVSIAGQNHAPVISSLTANPASISTGAVTTVTCSASDPDSDTLTYNWSAASGAISGSGYQVTWTAPTSSSTYSIGCTVSDGKGGSVQRSTNVVVSATSQNHAPVITSLTANPTSVSAGAATTLTCATSDADGNTLTYNWSAVSGTISGSGAQITWTAPALPGGFTVNLTVSDGHGGSVSTSVGVNVLVPFVKWLSVSGGAGVYSHTMGIKIDGTLWAWGENSSGELGLGNTDSKYVPTRVGSATNWSSVSAGYYHTVAIKTDGTLWAWGSNSEGALGLGDATDRNTPTQVGSAANWAHVSAGEAHTLAVKTDGTIWVWGYNMTGQLGLGDMFTNRYIPTRLGSATDWVTVSGNYSNMHAVKTNGTVWAWGDNAYAKVYGDFISNYPPIQVETAANWSSVSGGLGDTLGVKPDKTLWGWGVNGYGTLGLGDTTERLTPTQVGSATNWATVSVGEAHSLAVKTDGTLWAWGSNAFWALGLGDGADRTTPTQLGSATNWASVSASVFYSLAIKTDGTLWAWGENSSGQLGLGDATIRNTPTQVGN